MGNRLSKIYTRTGDTGTTSLGDKNRLSKNNLRIETLGTLDELNSAIGLVLAHAPKTESVRVTLNQIQQDLFNLGGELCPPFHVVITAQHVAELEKIIDEWNTNLPALKEFIMPGGNLKSASCHVARTVCRRAERVAVALQMEETFNLEILRYLNRLSDLLFVAARVLAGETHAKEILWDHDRHQ